MWGPAPVIRHTWHEMLRQPDLITPCAWDLLNIFRMECTAMVFAVYPLDVHGGTTLWESGYGWMMEKSEAEAFVGQQALTRLRGRERLWLGGLMALDQASEAPPLGSSAHTVNGDFAGYVTSAAFSIKYRRVLAFAHLPTACKPGEILSLDGSDRWQVCALPFTLPHQD